MSFFSEKRLLFNKKITLFLERRDFNVWQPVNNDFLSQKRKVGVFVVFQKKFFRAVGWQPPVKVIKKKKPILTVLLNTWYDNSVDTDEHKSFYSFFALKKEMKKNFFSFFLILYFLMKILMENVLIYIIL